MERYFLPKTRLGWSAIASAALAHIAFFGISIMVDQLGQSDISQALTWLMVVIPGLLVLLGVITGYLSYFKKLDKSIAVLISTIYLVVQTVFWVGFEFLEFFLQ